MAKKELRRMEIEPAENGGHTVTHHYKPMQRDGKHGMIESYMEPEHHVFGPDEGHDMLAHVANHLEIEGDTDEKGTGTKGPKEEEGDEDHKGTGVKGPRQYKGDQDEDEEKAEQKRTDRGKRMTSEKAKRVREAVAA